MKDKPTGFVNPIQLAEWIKRCVGDISKAGRLQGANLLANCKNEVKAKEREVKAKERDYRCGRGRGQSRERGWQKGCFNSA